MKGTIVNIYLNSPLKGATVKTGIFTTVTNTNGVFEIPMDIIPPYSSSSSPNIISITLPEYQALEVTPYKGDGEIKEDLGVIGLTPIVASLEGDKIDASQIQQSQIEEISASKRDFKYFAQKKLVDLINNVNEDMTTIPNPLLEEKIADSDFVFFLAFDVGGSRYLKKYQHTFQFINNNTRLMTNAFTLLQKYNVRFIFASSQMSNMGYSPYGILKNVGELYTKSLNGLIVKFWNVYGIENDHEKSHVITDFIRKGFETGVIDMMTDGEEERDFLYAEDCCDALETVMENFIDFTPEDNLHITSFNYTKIRDIASMICGQFSLMGKYDVVVNPSKEKDSIQLDKRNKADTFILTWWMPKTNIQDGISKVFNSMRKEYESN